MKVKKAQKAQMGKDVPKKKAMTETGKMVDRKEFLKRRDSITKSMNEQYFSRPENSKMKPVVPKKKAKSGGSFPDLNKDGKITKADILKGRGVIKNGAKLKKAKSGATLSPSKQSVSDELGGYKRVIGKNYSGKAKSGASVKKKAMYGVDMTPGAKMKMGGKSPKKAMGGMKMMKGGGKCKYGC